MRCARRAKIDKNSYIIENMNLDSSRFSNYICEGSSERANERAVERAIERNALAASKCARLPGVAWCSRPAEIDDSLPAICRRDGLQLVPRRVVSAVVKTLQT